MMSRKKSAKDFQILDCIGEGSYSKVYKAVYLHNRRTYAVKILSKRHIVKEKKIKYVTIEKTTLNRLGHHPGVVTLYYTFQDIDSLYFVIDYANNGEMLSLLQKLGSFSEALAKYYMIQLVDAVEFIHSKGIIHRDLKPENILLSHDWKLMVTDFGAAKILQDDTTEPEQPVIPDEDSDGSPSSRTGSFVGTAEYVSPELLKYNQCGFECDLWAIGCILYQLIVGRPPFKGTTEYQTFEKIIKLEYEYPANYFVPGPVKKMVESLLVTNPDERMVMRDLKQMEWFKGLNWTDKDSIWKKPVPRFESYNPRLSSRQQKPPAAPQQQALSRPIAYHYVEPGQKLTSHMSSMPQSVLKKQIAQASNNQVVMNRILTQKLADKNREIKEQQARIRESHNAAQAASTKVEVIAKKLEEPPLATPPGSSRSSSTSSVANGNGSVRTPPNSTTTKFPLDKKTRPSPTVRKSSSSYEARRVSSSSSPTQANGMSPTLHEMMNPQHSQEAISAAGAIGSLMNHNRSFLSSNSRPATAAGSAASHQQVINPILLDKNVPRDIMNRLMTNEYILKLDNIFKSELPHKVNMGGNGAAATTLDDVILNKIINENYTKLSRELKSCILIITSMARLLIFEMNSDFQLQGPQSSTQLQALAFYSNVVEIRLTNKNVSMYDYEFDEELKEGYLILELVNLNKLIFLSNYDSKTIVRGGINSNVRVGFTVNPEVSWIDSLLKAKDILRQQAKSANGAELRKSKSHSPGRGVTKAMGKMNISPNPNGKRVTSVGTAPDPNQVADIMKPKQQNHFAAAAAAASARPKK